MKITHLIFAFNTTSGGAETMLVDIVNYQVEQAEVNIILINKTINNPLVNKIDKRVKVYFINRNEGSKNPYPIIKLNRLLIKLKSDILHCHNHNISPLLLPIFRKIAVLTLHCMNIPTIYLHKYHKLYAISKAVRNDIWDRAQIDSVVIYNGILTSTIKVKKDYRLSHIFKIICIGRLEHQIKGQHLAIEMLKQLNKNGITNIKLDIIGSGSSELFLKDLTDNLGLTDQVNFLGLRDRNYIYTHLKYYDLLIQPSLVEGFGLTVVEAMVAKLPVLVSNIDGPMEIIENGKYGYFFENNNVNNLTKEIKEIIKDYNSDISQNKIEQAYMHVCKCFSLRKTAQNYLDNYCL